jgi:hypothetical protein
MEEAIQDILKKFYTEIPNITDVKVVDWSPDSGFMTLRWKEGDATVTVKSFDYGAQKVITRLR